MESILVIVVVVFLLNENEDSFNETMKTDSFIFVKTISHVNLVLIRVSFY